ncbi:hypothetical protein D3C71_301350 [compost metagenome]
MTALYSAITDFVTGLSLLEGDRAVCIVLDLKTEPRRIHNPTDMAHISSLPIFGRVGEQDDFVPELDDYAAEMFGHVIRSNWHAFAERARKGPAAYSVERHFQHEMLLAPAYVSEGTFRRVTAMARSEEESQKEVWAAAEIFQDAKKRYRAGDKQDTRSILALDHPCMDEWPLSDGRTIEIPRIMRRFNSNECQLNNLLRFAMKDTMAGNDTIFDAEIGYRRLDELQSFSLGLFNLGRHFQPSRHAGDMNLVENASFMIGELQQILGSAHLDPEDIERLRAQLSDVLDIGSANLAVR